MMSAPQPYPTVSNLTPAPDDAQIESKTPSICVDYLSHNWAQEDVWSSWKAMTKRKNEIANGVRLENASWRTWAKQRGNLKTISPETLNWLKDSDVTWLYGPLHEHADPVPPPKVASTADRLDLIEPSLKKSILKHRTISEMLTTPGRSTPPAIEALPSLNNGDSDTGDEGAPTPGSLFSVRSESNLASRKGGLRMRNAGSPPITSLELRSSQNPFDGTSHSVEERRHISFNQRVEQCISIDVIEDSDSDEDNDDDDDDDYDAEESSDEDEVLTMKSSPRMSPSLPMTSTSSLISSRGSSASGDHTTIAKLAPTLLKTSDAFPAPSPAVVDPTGFANHGVRSQPITSHYGSTYYANAVPATGGRWGVNEDYAGDFDYFSGPEVADEYDAPSGVRNDHSGRNHIDGDLSGRSPEGAPKSEWSQGSSDSSSTSIGGVDSSNSPPSVQSTQSSNLSAAQPRSILKRRPSPDHQNEEGDVDILGVSQPGRGVSPPMVWRAAHGGSNAGGAPGGSFESNRAAAYTNGPSSTSPEAVRSININSPTDSSSSSRGRPAQRLGSSASYERLQDASRGARTRSISGGASVSPSGSYEGAGASTYAAAAAHAARYRGGVRDGTSSGTSQSQANDSSAQRDTGDDPSSSTSDGGMQRSAPAERERRDSFRDTGGRPSIEVSGAGSGSGRDSEEIEEVMEEDEARGADAGGSKAKNIATTSQPDRRTSAERRRDRARATAAATAEDPGLNIDTANVPSNDPHSSSPAHQPGPTPLNTPVLALARSSGNRKAGAPQPTSPVLPRRTSATGALVAPESNAPRVPLAEDYVDEDEGGIIGRAVEIVNTARDLIGALLGNADRGRAWREG